MPGSLEGTLCPADIDWVTEGLHLSNALAPPGSTSQFTFAPGVSDLVACSLGYGHNRTTLVYILHWRQSYYIGDNGGQVSIIVFKQESIKTPIFKFLADPHAI